MTEKEKLIARIKELGVRLNREVSTSGTIQELTMRIAELEEELDDGEIADTSEGGDVIDGDSADEDAENSLHQDLPNDDPLTESRGGLVSVETLATLHIEALHAHRDERVSIVEPGVVIRVSDEEAGPLISQGLVREA